ncbi:hypothetical protein ASPACDRAFT_114930 [Aspergillus aculeatus ATCC 16872]|uniref:Peroxisomal biogenesis factor 11 n=1 Tax=Aspergillus aculeatus (strain ATCC 16872 / CBS 172.66 / WB 5094) TaxID=690307 RepID=A0A1L9X1A5_ASPA1|nr:uncharacterized protein ASPACDRAFT_114930 [Aspergillus aculeatus ATCC 16872]OJK02221.1 hypothetical protein ASPACDRAFT_114930 [Aspergillus aculeatus ATCC 16872]
MLDRLSRFYRLNTGYEKTLRLIQALCLVALEIGSLDSITTKRVSAAKSQLALIRRCIRFWNFLDCFNRVSSLLGQDAPNSRKKGHAAAAAASPTGFLWLLEVAKWSCFGVYFLLEDLTLLHAAEIYPVPWAKTVTVEAFKFWYYALALSLFGAVWEWYSGGGAGSVGKGVKKVGGKRGGAGAAGKAKGRAGAGAAASRVDTSTLLKRVVVDGCDLLIPGTYLGWMGVGPLGVGVGMVVSTVVSLREIWRSV